MNNFKPKFCQRQNGFSLVEIILTVALFGLFATALLGLLMNSYGSNFQASERQKATLYAQQGLEAVWSIRRQAWNLLANGDYGLANSGGYWQFFGSSDLLENKYSRVVTIADVCRDGGGNIVDCPGGLVDLYTKKATVRVSYPAITGVGNEISLVSYLTNWQSKNWIQTDWVGGPGQSQWLDGTKYDSDDGNIDVSTSGQVSLVNLSSGSCEIVGSCSALPANQCNTCQAAGCARQGRSCSGALDCSIFSDQASCSACGQCGWVGGGGGGSCSGTPSPCSDFVDSSSCSGQSGCSWTSLGSCNNIGSCASSPGNQCNSCSAAGCAKQGKNCTGTLNCSVFTDQASCSGCGQCGWTASSGFCSGTPLPCEGYGDQVFCLDQAGCSWDSGGSGYASFGYLISSAFNTLGPSGFNVISWSASIPSCSPSCEVKLQIRTASDAGGSPGAWSSWSGAAGAGTYFTDPAGTIISADLNFDQWIQYRVELIGDGLDTPILAEVKINYTP